MPAATMGVSDLKGANMSVEQASGHEPVELGFIESLENMISVQEGSTVSRTVKPFFVCYFFIVSAPLPPR